MNAKKTVLILKTLLFSVLFAGLFISCDILVDGDDTKYSFKPDVKNLDGDFSGIGITSKYRSDSTDFIYVFRRVVPSETSTETPVEENIGIINQKGFKYANTFLFQDQYVTVGTEYEYKTVFHDVETDKYHPSSWSNKIKAKTGYGPLVYDKTTAPTSINYNNLTSSLTLDKNVALMKLNAPTEDIANRYYPTLIINNGKYSRYFPLSDGTVTEILYINLRDLVSDDFVNVPITIPGIVGMYIDYTTIGEINNPGKSEETEESKTKVIKYIHFTSALDISETILKPVDVEDIIISTFQGTGIYLPSTMQTDDE